VLVYRNIFANSWTGPLPTELGTMDALEYAYVRHPHPPRLDACAVTGLWAERGDVVGVQVSIRQRSHGPAADRAGHHGRADPAVRAPPLMHASRRRLGELNKQFEGRGRWESAEGSQGRTAEDVHAVSSNRCEGSVFQLRNPGAAMVWYSDRTDGLLVARCRELHTNTGLCGPVVPLSSGAAYYNGVTGTNLGSGPGNVCPTASPTTSAPTTTAPTVTTVSPTTAPTVTTVAPTTAPTTTPLPCCERLRLNPVFCAMEKINRPMMAARCQVCGPPPWSS
jgi:hypothetical protein